MNAIAGTRTQDDQRGAVLIEFALVLPILLLLMAGMFDFGFAFQKYQAVTNAAREGARMAVLPGYSVPDVQARVAAYLAASGVSGAPTATVEFETPPAPPGGASFSVAKVHVQLTHTFQFLGPIAQLVQASFGTVTLTADSVMRTEVAAGGS
jgi:Flp pilus assembly protein TadG